MEYILMTPDNLRKVIHDFVDQMVRDPMIGFFFAKVDIDRLKLFEYQHAAQLFDFDIAYEGRPLTTAHRAHRIMGGQFDRRKEILRKTLTSHRVDPEVQHLWLKHVDSLRDQITGLQPGECH